MVATGSRGKAEKLRAKPGLDSSSSIIDKISIMKETPAGLNHRIAARVRALRTERGLPLAALEEQCGVSRSMISLIERGESSPTAVVLEKLAAGLGVHLAALFDAPPADASMPAGPLSRRESQAVWRDPASGYTRRCVSPTGRRDPVQIVEVRFPAGARVAFDNDQRAAAWHQQVWVLAGAMNVTVGAECHRLEAGDCLAMELDQPTMFHNPTKSTARYAVVLTPLQPARP